MTAESYSASGRPDTARFFADRMIVTNATDSLNLYSAYYRIAKSEGDYKEALDYKLIVDSIYDDIMQSEYSAHLAEVEKKYDNAVLHKKLYQTRSKFQIALSGFVVLFFSIVFLIIKIHNRNKTELLSLVNRITSLENELITYRDKVENLENTLHEKENTSPNETKDLEAMFSVLESQTAANNELMSLNGDLLALTKEISEIFYIHGESTSGHLDEKIRAVLARRLPEMQTFVRIKKMLELVYPGFTSNLFSEFPWLTGEQQTLICLMCCGFSANATSIIMEMDVKKLNDRKAKLANKMHINGRLSTYLKQRLSDYQAKKY